MRGRCVAATAEPVGMFEVAGVGGGLPGPGWIIRAVQRTGNRTGLERTLQISLVLKGLDGALELLGAALLLLVSPTQPGSVARFLTQHELPVKTPMTS